METVSSGILKKKDHSISHQLFFPERAEVSGSMTSSVAIYSGAIDPADLWW